MSTATHERDESHKYAKLAKETRQYRAHAV